MAMDSRPGRGEGWEQGAAAATLRPYGGCFVCAQREGVGGAPLRPYWMPPRMMNDISMVKQQTERPKAVKTQPPIQT